MLDIQYGDDSITQFRSIPIDLTRPAGMQFGIVLPDYDTVWVERLDTGGTITIRHSDRNTINERRNGKVTGANWGRPAGDAVPATARFSDDTKLYLNCELQNWIFDLNKHKAGTLETAKRDFRAAFAGNRFMSNREGSDAGDCINQPAADPPHVFPVQPMMCGGSLFRWIDEDSDNFLVEAINPLAGGYEAFNEREHPWLFFIPTISARERIEDKDGNLVRWEMWYQEPFHNFGERFRMPVIGFIKHSGATITGHVNKLPKFRGRILGAKEPVPHPYFMRDRRFLPNPYFGF